MNRTTATRLFAFAVMALAGAASAQESANFQLTPFAGYRMGGEIDAADSNISIKLEDSPSFGLLLNWPTKDNTEWEILYSSQRTQADISDAETADETTVDFDTQTLQLGGTYLFEGNNTVLPYLAMTLGGTYVSTNGESDTFFSGSIGLGIKLFPSSRVGLRLEARAYGTLVSSSTRIFCNTAPEISGCAVQVAGDIAGQVETFAGLTVRF